MTIMAHGESQRLETGYDQATPTGDNVALDAGRTLIEAYETLFSALGARTASYADLGLHLGDLGSPSFMANQLHGVRPLVTPDERAAAADAIAEFYGSGAGGSFIGFLSWPTQLDGLTTVGHPPLMYWPSPQTTAAPPGVTVRVVEDEAGLLGFERVLVDGFPTPGLTPWTPWCFLNPGALRTRWRWYVAEIDGDAVACAAGFDEPQLNLVEFVATLPAYRGRGIGAAVTSAAAGAGVPSVLIASDDGQPVYRRLGYLPLLRYQCVTGVRRGSA